jgi:hypothetical protein
VAETVTLVTVLGTLAVYDVVAAENAGLKVIVEPPPVTVRTERVASVDAELDPVGLEQAARPTATTMIAMKMTFLISSP